MKFIDHLTAICLVIIVIVLVSMGFVFMDKTNNRLMIIEKQIGISTNK